MANTSRVDELRRRVQGDPASIAFAQLAEEYRRAGQFAEAIETCRAGLARHAGYVAARVTLGRSLIEANQLEAAEAELSEVLREAPESLAAIRGLAVIAHRRGKLSEALMFYTRALSLARNDPGLERMVEAIRRVIEAEPPRAAGSPPARDAVLLGLGRFLKAIQAYRQRRSL